MGLNQRIIFTSHPKRRKRGASHFHQEFPSRNAEKAGEKTEEERKGSVGIAPALPGNCSGSSWESLRLSPRTLRDSAGPKPQQSAGARESHRHIPGTADPTRSRLAAPGDNCGVKGFPWATGLGFPRGLFQGKTWKHREQARLSPAEQGGKEGRSRIPVPRSAERVDPHGRKPNVEQHVENGLGGRKQAGKIQEFESKRRSLGRRGGVPASFASAGFRLNSQLGIKAIRQQQNKVLLQF